MQYDDDYERRRAYIARRRRQRKRQRTVRILILLLILGLLAAFGIGDHITVFNFDFSTHLFQ